MPGEKIFRAALVLLRTADAHGDGCALVMSYETFEEFAYYLESRSTTPACEEPQAIHWRRKPMLRGVSIVRTRDVEGVRLAHWSETTVELTEPDDPSLLDKALCYNDAGELCNWANVTSPRQDDDHCGYLEHRGLPLGSGRDCYLTFTDDDAQKPIRHKDCPGFGDAKQRAENTHPANDHVTAGDDPLIPFALVDSAMIDAEELGRLREMAMVVARSRFGPLTPPQVIADMMETHRMWARVYEVFHSKCLRGASELASLSYPDPWQSLELAREHLDGSRHGRYWLDVEYLMDILGRQPLDRWREKYGAK